MTAYIPDDGGPIRIVAKPAGHYGFGTVGLANPERMLADAWRMVQRAGLARATNRESGRIISTEMHTVSWVEYDPPEED